MSRVAGVVTCGAIAAIAHGTSETMSIARGDGRPSPVPAAPVTPPAVPSPPKSPPRELLEDQPPRPPGDDTTNELDFDDCGRDPGPCAIARALSQLQSSVAPRRMVMV